MKSCFLLSLIVLLSVPLSAQINFSDTNTTASQVSIAISNAGTYGNAFRGYRDGTGNASGEYPRGSSIEHLYQGGFWVGGVRTDGTTLVSTSAIDLPQGYGPGRAGCEFTFPANDPLQLRSNLPNNPNFDIAAVSHEDIITEITDANTVEPVTGTSIPQHTTPMGLSVRQEVYNWGFAASNFFVVVDLTLTNNGSHTFDSLFVGLYNNTVVRNVNVTPAGAGGSAFYNKGGNGYMDDLHMAYGYDAAGDTGSTESYVGQVFLGSEDKYGFHHPDIPNFQNRISGLAEAEPLKLHYNTWEFNCGNCPAPFFAPGNDDLRFQYLSAGINHNPCWDNPGGAPCQGGLNLDIQNVINQPGNRSDLVGAGPFKTFAPGDEVKVTFAYVFAPKQEDGQPNSVNSAFHRANLITNVQKVQQYFNGEDVNFNGVLDAGEDLDNDNSIDRWMASQMISVQESTPTLPAFMPNPIHDFLRIDLGVEEYKSLSLQVWDVNGKRMARQELQDFSSSINLPCSKWPAGLYLVHLQDEKGRIFKGKVVKE